jgi:SSS family transporter
MIWLSDYWFRLALIALYLALLAHHGCAGKKRTRDLSDYLVAGRGLGGWVVGLSFYATFVSTNTFVGQAGKSWEVGLIWYVKALVFGGLCYAAWYLVAPRFVRQVRRYDSLTVADFLGYRYGSTTLRRAAAVVIFAASTVYLVAVYKGSAMALERFLGLRYELAALVIGVVVTGYTLAGGFRSVVLTDAVQGLLMAVGAVAIAAAVLAQGGGPAALLETVRHKDPALVSWHGKMPLASILGLALAGGLKFLVEPRQLSRIYGLRDDAALRRARLVSPLLILITYLALLPIGALAHGIITDPNAVKGPDDVMPYLLGSAELLGPAASSFFLLVLISAAMSSLDSVLLVAASSVDHDLIAPGTSDDRAIARTRIWVVVLSALSMLLALNPWGDIVEITAFSGSLYGACFLPTVVVGLYWRGGTAAGALAGVFAGGTSVVGWFLLSRYAGWPEAYEVYVGLVVGMTAYAVVSLFTAGSRDDTVSSGVSDLSRYGELPS